MNKLHTGFIVANMLMEYGVEYIFGIPGGQTLPLYDATYANRDRIKHIIMRDERDAGHAACAYSRISKKVGVCDATVGPGATNLPSALGEALNSSTPLIAIIGEHPTAWINKIEKGRASQGIDQISMLKAVTKKTLYVTRQDIVPSLVKTAFAEATSGRAGPVALVIPSDVFQQEYADLNTEIYIDKTFSSYPAHRFVPEFNMIREASKLIKRAHQPVMLIGGGAIISGAMDVVKEFAEKYQIPLVYTITGKGILADDHPLNMGVAGIFANVPSAETALREADLVFIIGSKNSQSTTFGWTLPTPNQKVIHLDIDPAEVGTIFRTDIGLVGDAKLGLTSLLQAMEMNKEEQQNSTEWIPKLQAIKSQWEARKIELFKTIDKPIKPYRIMDAINNVTREDDIIVCDAGFASAWGAMYITQKKAGRYQLYPRGLAGLGFAVAAGIGAQLAAPNNRIITLSGDGAFTYDMAELAVEAKMNLPIINIVLNNSAYGWVRWAEGAWYGNSFKASELQEIDFSKIAEGLGCVGIKIENPSELEDSIRYAINLNKPVVLDVSTDSESTPIIK